MSRSVRFMLALVFGLAAVSSARAEEQGQTRDAARGAPAPVGSARITGRVVTQDARAVPLKRVIVTLTGSELPGGRTAITDSDGRFTFDRLPSGRFTVAGTKPAYLAGAFGSSRPGRPAVVLQLAAGEQRADVTFSLARGAAVSGSIRDGSGEPAAGVEVTAFRLPLPGGDSVLVTTKSATTDDRGAFRIYGLTPGTYIVGSTVRLNGRLYDVAMQTTSQVDEALADLQRRATPAGRTTAPLLAPAPTLGAFATAPMFYPGTPAPADASRLTLAAGEDRDGVDFSVRLARTATITGTVTENGAASRPLIINPAGLELPSLMGTTPTYSSEATSTGRAFKFTNVVPGRYSITAESTAAGAAWARTDVEVAGEDVSGVNLTMQPALRMSGRLVFEGANARPTDLSTVFVRLASLRGGGSSMSNGTRMGYPVIPAARVAGDGTFVFTGILPDTYRLTAQIPNNSPWTLRSAIVNGVDVLDRLVEVGTADLTAAVLTFSDTTTTLSGAIVTAAGQPAPAFYIAAFPADRALWRPQSRRIQSARAGTDGRWTITGLPAGDYLIAALSDLGPEDLLDPAFLESLAPAGVKVTLGEGEEKTQDFKIGARSGGL